MSDEVLTPDDRKLLTVRVSSEMWSQLDAIRKERKWTWQVLLVDILEQYMRAYNRRKGGD